MKAARKQRGAALVELAVSIMVLIVMVGGMTEYGRAIILYDTLAKSARNAARFLAVRDPAAPGAITDAKCMAVYGNPDCSGSPLATNLTTAMVSVCYAADPACAATHQSQGTAPVINLVSITIGGNGNPYAFTSVIPFIVPSFNFGAINVTMRQVL